MGVDLILARDRREFVQARDVHSKEINVILILDFPKKQGNCIPPRDAEFSLAFRQFCEKIAVSEITAPHLAVRHEKRICA
ncbi:hypothetical protein [Acidomonas methanolica]|uniref:hypothetical protein n=1 Tax=Acidomonas methanolica TaxID=437 RepID=UPI00211A41B8|nr:hypothetical protein [Acidomonas methanolica]MCQ9154256.1 hypothetical protein [Acidomonas methanolica]